MNRLTRSAAGLVLLASSALVATGCSSNADANPTPSVTVPTIVPTGPGKLPKNWPAGIPVPHGLELIRVSQDPDNPTGQLAIYYGAGQKTAINSQMTAGLKAGGYKLVSATNRGPTISLSSWKKGSVNVGLNVNTAAGKVSCLISVYPLS